MHLNMNKCWISYGFWEIQAAVWRSVCSCARVYLQHYRLKEVPGGGPVRGGKGGGEPMASGSWVKRKALNRLWKPFRVNVSLLQVLESTSDSQPTYWFRQATLIHICTIRWHPLEASLSRAHCTRCTGHHICIREGRRRRVVVVWLVVVGVPSRCGLPPWSQTESLL